VRAKRFFDTGHYEKSLVFFESAFKYCPNRIDLLQYLAWNYSKVGRQNKVAEILTTMIQINSDDIKSEKWLADTYYGLKDYAKAEEIYRNILKRYNDPNAKRTLAEILVWREKYSQAIPMLKSLLDENQDDLKLLELLADVYSWQKQFTSSIDVYNKLLTMSLKREDRKRVSLKLAEVYRYNGQNEEAIKLYEKFFAN
jgi:tetratricopeptide (TPR) repeat protein